MTKISGDRDSFLGYTGHIWHTATGLDLALFRAYDPNLGRWLSRDPSGEKSGPNLYSYVDNDIINASDPTGLETFVNCSADEQRQISQALNEACSFFSNRFMGPQHGGLNFLCQHRDILRFDCGPCSKPGRCGETVPRLGSSIKICKSGFNKTKCGPLKCTIAHEMVHSLGIESEAPSRNVEKCMGCPDRVK